MHYLAMFVAGYIVCLALHMLTRPPADGRLEATRRCLDATRVSLEVERQRGEAQTATIRRLEGERDIAAAQIWTLAAALNDATTQVAEARSDGVRLGTELRQGDGLLARFCRN